MDLEGCKELALLCTCTLSLKDPDEASSVFVVLGLSQVEEYYEEEVLINVGKILGDIDIHGCRPHASPHTEPVEDIMKLDYGPEAGINDGIHELP